jgi:hypothetical protein
MNGSDSVLNTPHTSPLLEQWFFYRADTAEPLCNYEFWEHDSAMRLGLLLSDIYECRVKVTRSNTYLPPVRVNVGG